MGVEIRTYADLDLDRAELRELFGRVGKGSLSGSLWGHAESEAAVYLTPYMDLEPESLFVASVDGALVGYLAGSLGSAIPNESTRMDAAIREHRLFSRRECRRFFVRAMVDVAWAGIRRQPTTGEPKDPRWPAHLHINLVPEARGTGVGAALMSRWLVRLREAESAGCYLQTLVENTRAVRFFEKMDFAKHGPTPQVPGLRASGRRLHQQTMVWNP
jgi:ribosomal protein S18 acetylase RimI-like enzyme